MIKILSAFLGGLLLLCGQSGVLMAKALPFEVRLGSIERIQSTEARGDELYFNVTEYSSVEEARHYQVPSFPTHWLSDHLKDVKDVVLWEKSLLDDEAVELIISLVERDVPPWNVDDLVGSVKLKLRNHNGQMEQKWIIPDKTHTALEQGTSNTFLLTGDGGKYRIALGLQAVNLQ